MVEQLPPKVLCWDLHDTIGYFDGVVFEDLGEPIPESIGPVRLRYGIQELLGELTEAGFTHCITTIAPAQEANELLERAKLRSHFQGVFGEGTIHMPPPWGKYYRPVATEIGVPEEEMAGSMLAIGDDFGDKPMDSDMVFLDLPKAHLDAIVIREIITTLLEAGDGHFKKGFEALYDQAVPDTRSHPFFEKKQYDMRNGIQLTLEYWGEGEELHPDDATQRVVPVVSFIDAPDYIREGDLI